MLFASIMLALFACNRLTAVHKCKNRDPWFIVGTFSIALLCLLAIINLWWGYGTPN